MVDVECALEIPALLGESPVWCVEEQVLYWTDIPGQTFNRFDPATGKNEVREMPEMLGSFALREGGGFVGGLRSGFAFLEFDSGRVDFFDRVLAAQPDIRLNDGRCDRRGRFFCGGMDMPREQHRGDLYRLDPDRRVTVIDRGVQIANGLAWSPDDSLMYFADSRAKEGPVVWVYDYDIETGTASNKRDFIRPEAGIPDGCAVDADGFYWSCHPRTSSIVRYSPSGKVDGVLELPVRDATMCAFGGPDLDTLYITTARQMMTDEELTAQPLAGSLLVCKPGVKGLPEPKFTG